MPWFGGGGGRGADCDDVPEEDKKHKSKNKNKKKECDGCFPGKASTPIVVKITRPRNNVNYRMQNNANRFGTNRPDCCKWCNNKANVNQMVFNQNKINNFDLINKINDINASNASAANPNVPVDPNQANPNLEKKKCGNCIKILREKELELLKKEQEILKIKTHFTTLPKTGNQDGLGTNCEHCFKALREKEYELFRKEQEIAKMKMAAITNPIDTQAKVDKAKCANCFKALHKKELELLKKEHELRKNLARPNINVKNLNYCSCCRDKTKSSANQLKKAEEIRKRNRDNCFKALRMKEIQLLQKERELDQKIQKFREESIAKARRDLEKVPDPRQIALKDKEVIKCVCSCSGPNKKQVEKERAKQKGICKIIYNILPPALGGGVKTTTAPQIKVGKNKSGAIFIQQPKRCAAPCCAFKLATNFTSYLLSKPGRKKKPEQKLPASCNFMKLVTWCRPGHLQQSKVIQKCCTIVMSAAEKEAREKEEQQIIQLQAKAVKTAKADSEAIAATYPGYTVDTVGKIRSGRSKSKSMAKLDVVEAEVLRTHGPKGLEKYKTKMAEIEPAAFLKRSKESKSFYTSSESGTEEYRTKDFKTGLPKVFKTKAFATGSPKDSISPAERYETKGPEKYGSKVFRMVTAMQKGAETERSREYGVTPSRMKSKIRASGFEAGDIETSAPKSLKSKAPSRAGGKGGDGILTDSHQTQKVRSKMPSFKTKVYDRATTFKTKRDSGAPIAEMGDGGSYVPKKFKTTSAFGKSDTAKMEKKHKEPKEVSQKKKTKAGYTETKASRKYGAEVDDEGAEQTKKKRSKDYKDEPSRSRKDTTLDDDQLQLAKKRKRDEDYEEDDSPYRRRKAKTGRPDDDDYVDTRSYRSRSRTYDDDVSWLMGPPKQKQTRYIPWASKSPPMPMFIKVLGQSLIYCAGCFIGVPCVIFLCLCLLCSTCSD